MLMVCFFLVVFSLKKKPKKKTKKRLQVVAGLFNNFLSEFFLKWSLTTLLNKNSIGWPKLLLCIYLVLFLKYWFKKKKNLIKLQDFMQAIILYGYHLLDISVIVQCDMFFLSMSIKIDKDYFHLRTIWEREKKKKTIRPVIFLFFFFSSKKNCFCYLGYILLG